VSLSHVTKCAWRIRAENSIIGNVIAVLIRIEEGAVLNNEST
jgi:hypothetical protein